MADYEDTSSESEEAPASSKKSKARKKIDKEKLTTGFPWWMCELECPDEDSDEPKPHEILEKLYGQMEDDQEARYTAYREYERIFGANVSQGGPDETINMLVTGELKQNELANTIETLWAQVFKNKIVPAVCVSEADFDEWYRAKAAGRWLEGAMDQVETFEDAVPMAGLYSLVYGTGPIKVLGCKYGSGKKKYGRVKTRAVNPKYLMVDRLEAKHGHPRQLFQKDHVDRFVALEEYGESADGCYGKGEDREAVIFSITSNDDRDIGTTESLKCDMLTVYEVWHLPSKPGAGDGRHCIWVKGCTLVYEKWDFDDFPFVWIRYGSRLEGFWGESAVKRLCGMQELLDKLNTKLDESQDVVGVARIIVRKGAGIKKADIDDIPGAILEAEDINGIRDFQATTAAPEMYQDRDNAPHKMRSLLGVSEFEAEGQLPNQTREFSAPAMERWIDQGQAKHAMFHKEYENSACKLGSWFFDMAAALEEDGYDVVVQAPGTIKSSIETLKFSQVKIDRERMKLLVLPMSNLPKTFAGKVEAIAKLKELMPNMPPQTVARMTEVPDINGQSDLMVSDEEIIMKNITWMVKKVKYLPPLPYDNFDLIISLTTRFINNYRVKEDAKMEAVGILSKYMEEAINMKKGLGGPDVNAPPPPGIPGSPMVPGPMGPLPPPGPPGMPPPGAPMAGPPPGAMPAPSGPPPAGMPPMPAPPMQM